MFLTAFLEEQAIVLFSLPGQHKKMARFDFPQLLPELQQVVVTEKLDLYSKQSLAMTCHEYQTRWSVDEKQLKEMTTHHCKGQFAHAAYFQDIMKQLAGNPYDGMEKELDFLSGICLRGDLVLFEQVLALCWPIGQVRLTKNYIIGVLYGSNERAVIDHARALGFPFDDEQTPGNISKYLAPVIAAPYYVSVNIDLVLWILSWRHIPGPWVPTNAFTFLHDRVRELLWRCIENRRVSVLLDCCDRSQEIKDMVKLPQFCFSALNNHDATWAARDLSPSSMARYLNFLHAIIELRPLCDLSMTHLVDQAMSDFQIYLDYPCDFTDATSVAAYEAGRQEFYVLIRKIRGIPI